MALSGIDAVIFGVADMAEAKRFLDDWGVKQISVDADRLVYETRDGAEVIVRPSDAPDLPAPIEPGNTVREVIWGADNAQELDKTLAQLKAGGGVKTGADGLSRICDPNGLSFALRVSQRRAVAVAPDPRRSTHRARIIGSINRSPPVHDRAHPITIGHVVDVRRRLFTPCGLSTYRAPRLCRDRATNIPIMASSRAAGSSVQALQSLPFSTAPESPKRQSALAFTVSDIHEVIGGIPDARRQAEDRDRSRPPSDPSAYFWYFGKSAGGADGRILCRRRFLHRRDGSPRNRLR